MQIGGLHNHAKFYTAFFTRCQVIAIIALYYILSLVRQLINDRDELPLTSVIVQRDKRSFAHLRV